MSNNQKKKVFPKIKKKLKGFLTDESGKITKKDALGLAVGGVLLSGVEEVVAGGHSNYWNPDNPYNDNEYFYNNPKCSHASGIVNGHYSATPRITSYDERVKHSSHSNHGSGGWC